jgi:SNF family Na+-dependent transporter
MNCFIISSDAIAIAVIDACTSIVCGTTVFSILGYIAYTQDTSVDKVIASGPGLIFMVLPEAIRNMNLAPLWAILFFTMVFLLGIDSQVNIFLFLIKSLNLI